MKLLLVLAIAVIFTISFWFSYRTGYERGWDKGANDLFFATIDTVQKICEKQLKSDTTTTALNLISKDTITYYLSRKTIILK